VTLAEILSSRATSDQRALLVEVALRIARAAGVDHAADLDALDAKVATRLSELRADADDIERGTTDTHLRRASYDEAQAWERMGNAWSHAMDGLR